MKRSQLLGRVIVRSLLTLGLLTAGLAMPASAQVPFGSLGGIAGGGTNASGVVPLHGWCLDDAPIRAVDIYVDGESSPVRATAVVVPMWLAPVRDSQTLRTQASPSSWIPLGSSTAGIG